MTRNLRSGELREDILKDLRAHEPLLELLDTSGINGVETVDDPTRQIYSRRTVQDTDFPVGVEIGMMRAGGQVTQSTSSGDFVVQATVNARLQWRQSVDQDPSRGLSESEMERILDAVGERANIAFAVPYLSPGGLVGGAEMMENDDGGQWSLPARWEVTRTVVGNDGPRNNS